MNSLRTHATDIMLAGALLLFVLIAGVGLFSAYVNFLLHNWLNVTIAALATLYFWHVSADTLSLWLDIERDGHE